jgi:hypothetical protein
VMTEQSGVSRRSADRTDQHRSSQTQPFHTGLLLEIVSKDEREVSWCCFGNTVRPHDRKFHARTGCCVTLPVTSAF